MRTLPAILIATATLAATAHAGVVMNTFDEHAGAKATASTTSTGATPQHQAAPAVQHGDTWNAAASGLDAAWDKAKSWVSSAKGTMGDNAVRAAEKDLATAREENDQQGIAEAQARLSAAKAEAAEIHARTRAYQSSADSNWEESGHHTKAALSGGKTTVADIPNRMIKPAKSSAANTAPAAGATTSTK